MWLLLFLVPSYFVGMIPFAVGVGRLSGHDVYNEGSKNPGASNVTRIAGWKWGALAMGLDIAKGFIPTFLAVTYFENYVNSETARFFAYLIAAAAICGHVLPIGRKGGKGVATGGGAFVALFPFAGLCAFLIWMITIKISKLPVVASLVAALLLPIWVGFDHRYIWEFIVVLALYMVIVVRHIPNIRRIIKREESSLAKENRNKHTA